MTTAYRSRVVELRRVRAFDLHPNPRNWRRHPPEQEAAMRALLSEIGFADAVIARDVDGELELLDGHLRVGLDPNTEVPVLIVDLDDEEADKFLLSFDPIGAMAKASQQKLTELLDRVRYDESELEDLRARLSTDHLPSDIGPLPNTESTPVRTYQLVYDADTFEEVGRMEMELRERFGTATISDTVAAAFKDLLSANDV